MADTPWFPDHPPTLPHVLANATRLHGDKAYLVDGDRRYTYREIDERSAALARGMLAAGIGKGTRIAILMPNGPEWIVSFFAATRIGAFALPLSTLFQPRELAWVLAKADIDTLLVQAEYAGHDYLERLERAVPGLASASSGELHVASHPYLRRIVAWGGNGRRWAMKGPDDLLRLAAGRPAFDAGLLRAAEAEVTPADWFLGICTSGSTAEPKIVVHTHGSVIRVTHAYRNYHAIRPDEINYCGMPFFWLGGINFNLLPVMYQGATIVFAQSLAQDDVLDTIVKHRVTRVSMWAVQQVALRERGAARGLDLSFVRQGLHDPVDEKGNPVPARLRAGSMLGMTESFGPHGVELRESILPPERAGSAGHTLEGIDRRIVDPESGRVLGPNEVGELQIRGFSMMQGYYKRERGEVFLPDGWFATGDLCRLDEDGYVYYSSRHSEMIKAAGANVAPREVEVALESLPGVREAIVFGVPDPVRGEAVVAVVVASDGETVDPAALKARLKEDISSYKVPRDIVVMPYEQVPRTDAGKPRKPVLRATLFAGAAGPA